MKVLILKMNQSIILKYFKNAKFVESTEHTCFFTTTQKKFMSKLPQIKEDGFNPYALMSW